MNFYSLDLEFDFFFFETFDIFFHKLIAKKFAEMIFAFFGKEFLPGIGNDWWNTHKKFPTRKVV